MNPGPGFGPGDEEEDDEGDEQIGIKIVPRQMHAETVSITNVPLNGHGQLNPVAVN